MRDLIILLPGITGSVLQKDGKDIWSTSYLTLFRNLITFGANLQQMKLEGDDHRIDDLGDGIKAIRIIPDAVLAPGLVKIDGYTKISQMIKSFFEVKEGSLDPEVNLIPPANYFEFPYDWRRDNRVAARWLKNLIALRLPEWRAHAGNDAKVILLAHSMGGLVARYYLEAMDGWKDCKALITFGTPYKGSLKALDYLANGFRKYFVDLTRMMSTFTSLYQLLPTYKVVNDDGEYKRVDELIINGISQIKAQEARAFHKEINDYVDSRVRKGNVNPYIIFPLVGTHQPTFQSAEWLNEKLTVSEILPPDIDSLLGHGDGTVPYLSAIPQEMSEAHRNSFFAENHGLLQCNDQVLDTIYDQLYDLQISGLENIRGPLPFSPRSRNRVAISSQVEDLYMADEPVIIRARIFEDGQVLTDMEKFHKHMASLEAVIEPVGNPGAEVKAALAWDGKGWLLEYEGLPPGIYRLTVQTVKSGPLAPPPIHDLFQVAAIV